jgi:galactokinase/mevalonate kinase-like predicted kinase
MPASRVSRAAEATAPCALDLAGGILAGWPSFPKRPDAVSVAVALDRRPYARVEAGGEGVRLESKDTLLRLEVPRASDLPATGVGGLVRRVLLALGLESGLQITTQARVPFEAGLGSAGALAVALAAAAARATGTALSPQSLATLVAQGEEAATPAAGLAAVWGAVVAAAIPASPGEGERLRVDPGRIEECMLLVSGSEGGAPAVAGAAIPSEPERAALEEIVALAGRMRDSLAAGRYDDVPALIAAEHEARLRLLPSQAGPGIKRLAGIARENGGAARTCGSGPGSVALVWASPGDRKRGPMEEVQAALRAAGYRTFPCRIDLRGLEVEETQAHA